MAGKIFALRDGGELTELTPSQYSNEDFFQGLIEKHPEIFEFPMFGTTRLRKTNK